MKPALLHEDKYLQVFWDEPTHIIGIDWKETTSDMTDEDFKTVTMLPGCSDLRFSSRRILKFSQWQASQPRVNCS